MKKKTILERWHCEEFVESVRPFIDAISAGHAVIRDADLAGLEVGPFAVIKELERSSLYGSHLENVNLSYANIHNLSKSILSRVNFSKATLERCLMRSCQIADSDFSSAKMRVNMDDTRYHHCRFTGTQFFGHGWLEFGGRRVKFYNCNFTNATFRRVELRAARFYDCIFDNTTFIKCELSGTKAEGERLPSAAQFTDMDIPVWAQ
ncbi:Uncharacterized protein YjbI, contains pentapeptide repeats [Paenibacillus tianmuensis]|uniref:Uncharacterized protein YjbI, contains pentapeptide repeats n=1 Tax=Paenibacillus tianmuensis TaxID=624147 RepID=A0A1G4SBW5_9BACL|nr:pentapeptide repeat-containing protein [Paenibacillus tianmuensis]SCW66684.1 Uncharacterized protein YjbI, contains pentapeptide repeats [Paenibacillus tianmuensis]